MRWCICSKFVELFGKRKVSSPGAVTDKTADKKNYLKEHFHEFLLRSCSRDQLENIRISLYCSMIPNIKYLVSCGRGAVARLWLDKAEIRKLSDIFHHNTFDNSDICGPTTSEQEFSQVTSQTGPHSTIYKTVRCLSISRHVKNGSVLVGMR